MNLQGRALLKIVGILFLLGSGTMILPLITGIIYGESSAIFAFATVIICSGLIGSSILFSLFFIKVPLRSKQLQMRDAFLIVATSWILISAISAFPYVIHGCIPNYIDAFFEASSGFTTTGSSILTDIEVLPKSMLFWRSFAHWLGGMGILVFAIALLPQLGISGQTIVRAETPGPTLSKITPKMSDTARTLYIIYTGFTLLETILLMFGGLNFFDALTHSFSTVGTGGFSNYNASVAFFDSAYVEGVLTVFMLLSGVNFNLYFLAMQGGLSHLWKDSELRSYGLIIFLSTLLLTCYLWFSSTYDSLITSFRYAIFQSASIITTTGFATADFDLWPTFCAMVLLCLFFVGGCSSSTGGGIKVIRVLIVFKMIKRTALLRLHPNAFIPLKVANRPVPGDTAQGISSFVFLYLFMLFFITIIVALDNYDFTTSFTATATCLGNIGPGFHQAGPTANFSIFSQPIKLLLSFTMIAGRLELFTLLMLLSKKFWNPSH